MWDLDLAFWLQTHALNQHAASQYGKNTSPCYILKPGVRKLWPTGQTGPLPASVSQVSLEDSHTQFINTWSLWLLLRFDRRA